jgi:hypothetical protein
LVILFSRVAAGLSVIFRLDWLYRFFGFLIRIVQRLLEFITGILEGEGGLLWVFVLLALLLSLISGITP